jgi:hypothetical protein
MLKISYLRNLPNKSQNSKMTSRENLFKKDVREQFEIIEVIKYINKYKNSDFQILEKTEKPDYSLKNSNQENLYIELTSVYLNHHSVIDHKKKNREAKSIPYSEKNIQIYLDRIIEAVVAKEKKASEEYDKKAVPLILSIYLNEYIKIHIEEKKWLNWILNNKPVFNKTSPFCNILLWPFSKDNFAMIIEKDKNKSLNIAKITPI